MLKKTITFKDYNDQELTEDFYFNLNEDELVELQVSSKEGFAETLQKIVASNDGEQIIGHFKKIILLAYGVKSENGRSFDKSQALRDEFSHTRAYSKLFIELATDAGYAAEFINGIVPAGMGQKDPTDIVELPTAAPQLEEQITSHDPLETKDTRPAWIKQNREPTKNELDNMSKDELLVAMNRKNQL